MRQNIVALLAVLFMPFSAFAAGFSYESYKSADIVEIAKGLDEISHSDTSANWFMGTMDKRRIAVKFSGSIEKIPEERRQFIQSYFKAVNIDPAMADHFENELLVHAEGASYRLPVQTVLIKYLQTELGPEDNVVLYVVVAGSAAKTGMVLLINEFDAAKPH